MWMNRKPNVQCMRAFGCVAYSHIDKSLRTSIHPTSTKCTFLGYAYYQKGYVVERELDHKIMVRRDVTFDESTMAKSNSNQCQNPLKIIDPMEIIDEYRLKSITI